MDESKKVAKLMLKTLFSTTLRIFAPVTILFLIGLAIDLNNATKPWGMLTGTVIGIGIAIVLIVSQLNTIKKSPVLLKIATDETPLKTTSETQPKTETKGNH